MGHNHNHHHHSHVYSRLQKSYFIGIGLNLLFIIAEIIAGFWMNSLALLTDAGHNFSDVVSLALSLVALRLAQLKPTQKFTYGYKKSTILAALLNAVILLFTIGAISWEAVKRLDHPVSVAGTPIALVALIGIAVNGVSALVFLREKELNAKGAYLHLLADALVSAGVVVGGVVMSYTSWYWIDPAISILITVVILLGTWGILKDSLRLSLDAVPKEIKVSEIEKELSALKGVKAVHHTHIWALSTTEVALTTHLVVPSETSFEQGQNLKNEAKHLLQHLNITHATIELESEHQDCKELKC